MRTTKLAGKVLYWTSSDSTNLVTVVVKQFLDLWQRNDDWQRSGPKNERRHQRLALDQLADNTQLAFSFWAIGEATQLASNGLSIALHRKRYPAALQLAYLAPELVESRGLFIESGAHFVVHQICQVHGLLQKLVDTAPLSDQGIHPLTSGLTTRLPWSFVDDRKA